MSNTVLFIDFDNTISVGDVLDSVIEKFSRSVQWLAWEKEWRENRMSSYDCLRLQVGDLDVDERALRAYVRDVDIDPGFLPLVRWAAETGTELAVVSDNFDLILHEILQRHSMDGLPVFANALAFEAGKAVPSFPYRSATCARCAHCKATHFSRYAGYRTLYVGDGLSDVCPALRADRVFAKDALAEYLHAQGVSYTPFQTLDDVVACLWAEAADYAGAN